MKSLTLLFSSRGTVLGETPEPRTLIEKALTGFVAVAAGAIMPSAATIISTI